MTKSERTKQFIVEQSAPIINKRGVAGTSISDLMDATQLAKGGIYGNFESKEAISLEAFKYLAGKVGKDLDAIIGSKETAKERLFAVLDYYARFANNPAGGCPLLNFGIEADDTNPLIRQHVAKSIRSSQQRISNVIEGGKKTGEFGKNVDAASFGLKIFATIEGAIFTSRVTNSSATMNTIINMVKIEIRSL